MTGPRSCRKQAIWSASKNCATISVATYWALARSRRLRMVLTPKPKRSSAGTGLSRREITMKRSSCRAIAPALNSAAELKSARQKTSTHSAEARMPANSDNKVAGLVDHLFRHQAGQMVSTLTRVFGPRHLDLAEEVVQDALLKALQLWPYRGIPDN